MEVLSHIRTLKVLSVEHLVFDRARRQSDVALEHELHAGIVGEGFSFLATLVAAVGTAALTWYGWTLILRQEMTLGTYIAFMAYVGFFSQPLMRISRMFADHAAVGGEPGPDVRIPGRARGAGSRLRVPGAGHRCGTGCAAGSSCATSRSATPPRNRCCATSTWSSSRES